MRERILLAIVLGTVAAAGLPFVVQVPLVRTTEGARLYEQGDGLMKNVEGIMAYGGMGGAIRGGPDQAAFCSGSA